MIMFGKKEKRFSVKEAEGYSGSGTIRIIFDIKTGVNFMTEGVGASGSARRPCAFGIVY